MVVNLCRGEFHPIMEGYAGTSLRDETIGASSVTNTPRLEFEQLSFVWENHRIKGYRAHKI
jgi:hypothetical protein